MMKLTKQVNVSNRMSSLSATFKRRILTCHRQTTIVGEAVVGWLGHSQWECREH